MARREWQLDLDAQGREGKPWKKRRILALRCMQHCNEVNDSALQQDTIEVPICHGRRG